jgi:hypothetical protein
LIVSVLVVGTGVYPINVNMSRFVRGEAPVTSPFPLTENLRGVMELNTPVFTVFNVSETPEFP